MTGEIKRRLHAQCLRFEQLEDRRLLAIQPTISISDVQLTEGDSGQKYADLTVTVSNPSGQAVTVDFDYVTTDGTATAADNDYDPEPAGHYTIPLTAGQTSATRVISTAVFGDTKYESNETFYVDLKNARNAELADARGMVTIVNNDSDANAPEWAILAYLSGDNNLERCFIAYLDDLEEAAGNESVVMAAQLDRGPRWWNEEENAYDDDTSHGGWEGTRRFIISEDKSSTAFASDGTDIGEADMGNPSSLTSFINWSIQNLPTAKNYALIVAGHSDGWPLICSDHTDNAHMSVFELRDAIRSAGVRNRA